MRALGSRDQVTPRIGLYSVLTATSAFALAAAGLLVGGLDSAGAVDPRMLVYPASLLALSGVFLGLLGLIKGPQRILSIVGILIGSFFALSWVGVNAL